VRPFDSNTKGVPPYAPALLLKLYIYFNRIHSSRMLERACTRNIELWWLLDRTVPSYHTIATFRTCQKKDKKGNIIINHRKALVAVFRIFNKFCDQKELLGKMFFSVNGTVLLFQEFQKSFTHNI
jgi:transposase